VYFLVTFLKRDKITDPDSSARSTTKGAVG